MSVNANPSARFGALLVETENNSMGLEPMLREQGCSVRKVTSRSAARDVLDSNVDLVVIHAALPDDEVLDLVGNAPQGAMVLVVTENTNLAVMAARLGASTVVSNSAELVSANIAQLLPLVDLKRRYSRQSSVPPSMGSSPDGVVQRRSTPLPKEATPDALDALIEAAEGLVPMHRFQRAYVDYALRRFGGNKVHTAAALGIDRRTIQRWARARAGVSTPPRAREATS